MRITINTDQQLPESLSEDEIREFCKYIKNNLTFIEKSGIFANDSDFIDRWFDLWPKGEKTSGQYVRTSKNGCKKKMKKFRKEHPQYTDDIILKATEIYVGTTIHTGFMKLAPYFIEKNGVSALEGACEALINQNENRQFTTEA